MDIYIRSGFEKISHHIKFQPITEKKGRLLVESGHVCHVQEIQRRDEKVIIEGQVVRQAAVSSTQYKTTLTINSFRLVIADSCTCVYNQSNKCKHIAALIYYINNAESLSKTSSEQLWGRPSARQMVKEKYSKGKNFCEMFPPRKAATFVEPNKIPISKLKSPSALKFILDHNKKNKHDLPKEILMKSKSKEVQLITKQDCEECIKSILFFCDSYEIYKGKIILEKELCDFYEIHVVLSEEKIISLCCDTIEQSTCSDWFAARVLRISASSKAHRIKSRVTKSIESLVSDFLFPKKVETAATQYGIKKESIARKIYEKRFNCEVKQIGVVISKSQPWLCASPDGIVVKDGCIEKLIEIKCPATCEKVPVVNNELKTSLVPYLYYEDEEIKLKSSSQYYTQIQIQMYVCGLSECDLFIYSPVENGSCVVHIYRDESFLKETVTKCSEFYFNYYLTAVKQKVMKSNQTSTMQQNRLFTGVNILNAS